MKKLLLVVLALVLVFSFAACNKADTSSDQTESKGYVGISMPTQSSERWISDGNNMSYNFV